MTKSVQRISTTCCSLKAVSLKTAPTMGKVVGTGFPRQGRGEGPPIPRVQRAGHPLHDLLQQGAMAQMRESQDLSRDRGKTAGGWESVNLSFDDTPSTSYSVLLP